MCAAARVTQKIRADSNVVGVTSVDNELFVLLKRDDNQVAVYSINDYRLLGHLNVPGFMPFCESDMTSCVRRKCLYMSDIQNNCIRRYDLQRTLSAIVKRMVGSPVSKWSVPGKPWGLSVTPNGNLLVTCPEPNKLVELNAHSGQSVREIALQSDIALPWHSVQLTTGQFVVCHGVWERRLHVHRVCVVGDDGKATCCYGGQLGSDVGQQSSPLHLAVDEDSRFIFVADWINDRVVLLSPTLEFVRYITEGLSDPRRLYFHQATRRLFVGRSDSAVTVIQL